MSNAKGKSKAKPAVDGEKHQSVLSRFFSAAAAPTAASAPVTDSPPLQALETKKTRAPAKRKTAGAAAAVDPNASGDANASIAAPAPAPAPTRSKRPRAAATAAAGKLREVVSIDDDDDDEPAVAASTAVQAESDEEAESPHEAPAKKRGKRAATASPPAAAPALSTGSFLASSAFSASRQPTAAAPAAAAAAASDTPVHPLFTSNAAAAAPASPFRPRPLASGEKLSLPSSFEPASAEAHQAYVDRLAAAQFAAEISHDPAQFNSYEQTTVLGGAAASSAAASAAASSSSAAASAAPSSSPGGAGVGFQTPVAFDLRSWSGVPGTVSTSKFTPLEQQVLALKRAHPDVLLLVEVGYKFRFFGRDAETAARLLDIYAHPSHNLLTASIPTFRCYIHVKRLVEAGLKVGVVRQTESATSKKMSKGTKDAKGGAGGSSNPLFARGISELYTKATSVPEIGDEGEGALRSSVPARFLMCLHEESGSSLNASSLDSSSSVRTSLLAVDPTSGQVVWDSFETGFLRSELETRLVALNPVEILVSSDPTKLSTNTARVLLSFAERASSAAAAGGAGAGGEGVRLEKLDSKRFKFDYATAVGSVERFFAEKAPTTKVEPGDEEHKGREVHVLDDDEAESAENAGAATSAASSSSSPSLLHSLNLPKGALICLGVLIPYLRSFGLDSCLRLTSNLRPFAPASKPLQLEGMTLHNLEVVRSQEGPVHGSLLWLLSHTKTAFGGRLLRQWILAPLTDRSAIEARLDAVDELLSADSPLGPLHPLLHQLPDLERGLARVQYGKCKPVEFLRLLDALRRVVQSFPSAATVSQMRAQLFRSLFGAVSFDEVKQKIEHAHSCINARAVEEDRKEDFFEDSALFPSVAAAKASIRSVEADLVSLLQAARKTLGPEYAKLEYMSVNNVEFLVEVKVADVKRVPKDWMQINTTKVKTRFHPPEVAAALDRLLLAREELAVVSGEAWRSFLSEFGGHYALLRPLIDLLASLDCLTSLACVAALPGYVRPQFVAEPVLEIVGARHPMIEASASMSGESFVPNDISMHAETGPRFSIVSGANMGGKSTYIRSVALCVILAQIGSFVPADSATLGVFDGVYTRMGARDSPAAGHSTFMVELSETSSILRQATPRSLVILDELGRGTSTSDGIAIAHATCKYILTRVRCCTLFVTHYPLLGRLQHAYPDLVRTFHMSYVEEAPTSVTATARGSGAGVAAVGVVKSEPSSSSDADADVSIPSITFLFKLAPGMAPSSFGLNVARMAHVPDEVLRRAAVKAQQMRRRNQEEKEKREHAQRSEAFSRLKELLTATPASGGDVTAAIARIVQLATPDDAS